MRSPYAHARINSIDIEEAQALPGVISILTPEMLGDLNRPFPLPVPHPKLRARTPTPLAAGKVRYSGEPVAVVVAESRYIAEDTLDLIMVVDRRGTFIRLSPSSFAILGYHPEELIDRSAAEILYAEDLDSTRGEMRAARRGSPTTSSHMSAIFSRYATLRPGSRALSTACA